MKRSKLVRIFRDGTVRHVNPLTGEEAWTVPGRDRRPGIPSPPAVGARSLAPREAEDLCNFCPARYRNTPPEKTRLVIRRGAYVERARLPASEVFREPAEFRRISNLFEIAAFSYWTERYGYTPPGDLLDWRDAYLADPEGYAHVRHVIGLKLRAEGRDEEAEGSLAPGTVRTLATPFFAGTHELIVARRHVREGARGPGDLCGPGDLERPAHARFLRFTVETARAIRSANPHVRYVYIFQNWRKPAGASFDHLHKQLVGTDRVGPALLRQVRRAAKGRRPYRSFLQAAIQEGLVVARNAHAVVVADPGRPHPAVRIFSLCDAPAPHAMPPEALAGLSDAVHACHAAWERTVPSNEVWFYDPGDGWARLPLQVVIQWRMNTLAGFEAGSGIYVNPLAPHAVRDRVQARLFTLREAGWTAPLSIGEEARIEAQAMAY